MHATLDSRIRAARDGRTLSDAAASNLLAFLAREDCAPWEAASVAELVDAAEWQELDDRFFRQLRFGTGGLRGRTIGRVVSATERGGGGPGGRSSGRPEHPAVGVNCMNYRAVADATRGLVRYLRRAHGPAPTLAVAYDTRHFSAEFARVVADVAAGAGATVYLYDAPASTPQLAFTVRARGAHAGVVITASHNPSHDNGYKIYLGDGSQIVEPAASEIAAAIEAVRQGDGGETAAPGTLHLLGDDEDEAFLETMQAECSTAGVAGAPAKPVRVVYSPLHGTGIRVIPRALARAGVETTLVEEQATPDGSFPTVPSPNPEDPRVYARALELARAAGAEAVIATDPDADRLGIAARAGDDYRLLSGNQIGALLADFRLARLFESGVLTPENASRAVIVKTFVTSDLIKAIAAHHGVRCVETLTGFKYIGAKLRAYAAAARPGTDGAAPLARAEALAAGRYLVLGCEESFGYLAGDYVRDKDANGAALMLAELLTGLEARGETLLARLDALYARHGYFADRLATLPFEGLRGAQDMARLLDSYRRRPPAAVAGVAVDSVEDFGVQRMIDADGAPVPQELMLRFGLADGGRVTVRGSGTEPKLKYYVALRGEVARPDALDAVKAGLDARLDAVWAELQLDVAERLNAS